MSSTDKPWMRKSWVVFLDVLGFNSRIVNATEAGTANELLLRFTAAVKEAKIDLIIDPSDYARSGISQAPYAVKMFTDNVILGFPIYEDGETEFGSVIGIVGRWQYTLSKHGFFLRGGMAVGPLYMDEDVVFGMGLIDAYNAESKLACDPRIVLANSAMSLVHDHLAFYSNILGTPHNQSLLIDSDSQMFVNYLYLPVDGAESLHPDFALDIKCHRDLIVSRLKEFSESPAIWSKYAWIGSYHNHFCDHYEGLVNLKVESALLEQSPRFLSEVYKKRGQKVMRDGKEVATSKHLKEWKVEKEPL